MANTRRRTVNQEGRNEDSETARTNSRQANQVEDPPDPPIPQMLRGIVDRIPQVEVEEEDPVMEQVDPQAAMMANIMQMMNTAMDRREERFMKLLEDRDAGHRRNETVAENALNGSGAVVHGTGTEEQVVTGEEGPDRGCSYKTFLCCKPPEFHGLDDPIACMNWIREIEQAFRACDCGEKQKVRYGSQMLRGAALIWWNILTSTLQVSVVAKMTWDSFKKKVLEEYCNEREMDRIENELRTLQKGDLSVREYTRLFMEKLNLVGHVAPTEKGRIKAYLKGLPLEMMAMVRNSKATTLRETIEEAKLMETVYEKGK